MPDNAGDDAGILAEQIAYYRARAPEYDDWFLRTGRYDRGDGFRERWILEAGEVEGALKVAGPRGDVLEIACGTGLWTRHLAPLAETLTAVDASPEVIALNRARLPDYSIDYVEADIFAWRPPRKYDFVFFGFWLSHVPRQRFESFFDMVGAALKPAGTVFFVDNLFGPAVGATDVGPVDRSGTSRRRLDDGRKFDIVKVFYEAEELEKRLSGLGWDATIRATDEFFFYGTLRHG